MSLTMAVARAALDAVLGTTGSPIVTHVEWSENGSTVSAKVAATAVTLEAAVDMTTYARKGIDVASPPQLSAAASSAGTITHWRYTTAASGGTAKTGWNALTSSITLASGEQIRVNDAGIGEKLTI